MPQDLLKLVDRKDLDAESSGNLIKELLNPANEAAWKGAILGSWACKGETAEELVGAARVILAKGLPLDCDGNVLDTCGTGGDGWKTFNISTATAIQGASSAAAMRLAVRITRAVVGLGPTQTSSRSFVAHGSLADCRERADSTSL